ncbi:MAG: hypothetical protein IPO08_24120 [Xanthomonadales bacterium]|nr:hypothetical protein [Xanthomonadales bacterium]
MKKKNQIAEVAVAADASSVLRLMAATFSNANKAVLELVQNAGAPAPVGLKLSPRRTPSP